MKKLIIAALGLLCATAIVVQAQETKHKKELTPEQQTVMKEMLAKYDTNKDGKIDKNERAAMTQEDKDKMAKAGLTKPKHKNTGDSTNAPASTDK
jgi:hypothetical protein